MQKKILYLMIGSLLLLLIVTQVKAYSYSGKRWSGNNPRVGMTIKWREVPSAWTTAIARGAAVWNSAGSRFWFIGDSQGHEVGFKRLTGSYANALALTTTSFSGSTITDCDTNINSRYSWDVNGDRNKFDVQNVMAHEFGHWLMLYDLYSGSDYWKTMYGSANVGETYKRTLDQDDINGIRAIYGT